MYNHHKRMVPKRVTLIPTTAFYRIQVQLEDAYRAEFPGNYYSSSSVYSYSPTTSTSHCPEHGRSRRRTTLILVTSVVLATLGVLSIAGIAAYLGVISKNISNNAANFEESYLQSNTSSETTSSQEEDHTNVVSNDDSSTGFIDLTNSLSDTETGLGPWGDDELINHRRKYHGAIPQSINRPPSTKLPEIVRGGKLNATTTTNISAKPVNVVVKNASPSSSVSAGSYNYYIPIDTLQASRAGEIDNSVTYFTEEPSSPTTTTKMPPRNTRNRTPSTKSHPLASSTTTQISPMESLGNNNIKNINHTDHGSSDRDKITHLYPTDAKKMIYSDTFAKRHGLVKEEEDSHTRAHPKEDDPHKESTHPKIADLKGEEEVSTVNPNIKPSLHFSQKGKPPQQLLKPIVPIINSESERDDLLNNHKMPLTFDRISPDFYDKNPWTPLLDRPNLDKRPRVEINKPAATSAQTPIIIWEDDVRESTSPASLPHDYNGYPHTSPNKDSTLEFVDNKSQSANGVISHGSTSTTTIYQRIPEIVPDEEEEEETSVKEQNGDTVPSYVEETTGGFRPLAIPAYTLIIPHIPNAPTNISQNLTKEESRRRENLSSGQEKAETNRTEEGSSHVLSKLDKVGTLFVDHSVEDEAKEDEKEEMKNEPEEDYAENDGDSQVPTKIYKLDPDSVDIVPDHFGASEVILETQDLKKPPQHSNFGSNSSTNEETLSHEPSPMIKSTTDLINTLGSLNLIKSPKQSKSSEQGLRDTAGGDSVEENVQESGTASPLFPPVRSYVSINLPLRPKPSPPSEVETSGTGPMRTWRMNSGEQDEDEISLLRSDFTTASSLQKVLSMMMKFEDEDEGRHLKGDAPFVNVTIQNTSLQLANASSTTSDPDSGNTPTTTHREQKSYNTRHSKIDEQFAPPENIQHVPVPLIVTEAPDEELMMGDEPIKTSSKIRVNDQNSPVYKFVLRQGQSIEDLLKEIFQNYTDTPEEVQTAAKLPPTFSMRPSSMMYNHASGSLKSLGEPSKREDTAKDGVGLTFTTNVKLNQNNNNNASSSSIKAVVTSSLSTTSTSEPPELQTATSIVVNQELSDEECPKNTSFKCVSNGKCIPSYLRCNFIKECPDNSDEDGCSCADFLRANGNGRKLCDGVVDCADASDEFQYCEYCKLGQYICAGSKKCINKTQICDSNRDCENGDDENDCVKIAASTEVSDLEEFSSVYNRNGLLMVRKKGKWGKLCVETFSSVVSNWEVKDLALAVCKALTFSDFESVERIEDKTSNSSQPYFELFYGVASGVNNSSLQNDDPTSSESTPRVGLGFKATKCKSKLVVNVTCQDLQCGTAPKSFTQTARIVGGSNSRPGQWPWQAALYKNGEYQCGATLISSRWLLSAGHCFYNAQDDYWVARLGTLRRGATVLSPYEQVVRITHVFLHPQYQNVGFVNDVSLLRLEKEVDFTDYVRPVCLPSKETKIRDGRMCFVVGWGQLFEVGRVFPDTLQEVQLPLISTSECRKQTLFLPLYKLTDNMFCGGFTRGGRDACLGDSGGPMMCQETDGRWSLYGVTSNGYGCARANRPGVYTKVSSYVDWIHEKMKLEDSFVLREKTKHCAGHRCLLGECLDKRQVCNGIVDCVEDNGSDERGHNCTTHLGLVT